MGLFCFLGNTLCFLAIVGIYLNKGAYGYCRGTTNHYPDKEVFVSDQFLQPTGSHTRQHHTQCHKSGADRIVCCLMFTIGVVNQVKHVGCEPEAITELLDKYT